jgi:hypothetical protein
LRAVSRVAVAAVAGKRGALLAQKYKSNTDSRGACVTSTKEQILSPVAWSVAVAGERSALRCLQLLVYEALSYWCMRP